jgi:hypothetical protein
VVISPSPRKLGEGKKAQAAIDSRAFDGSDQLGEMPVQNQRHPSPFAGERWGETAVPVQPESGGIPVLTG